MFRGMDHVFKILSIPLIYMAGDRDLDRLKVKLKNVNKTYIIWMSQHLEVFKKSVVTVSEMKQNVLLITTQHILYHRNSTHSRFYCQQSYRIMINPYNQKIKSVNIIWTCLFVFISIFFLYLFQNSEFSV